MWADFLSHFQEEADSAALYEAEVGEEVPGGGKESEEAQVVGGSDKDGNEIPVKDSNE
jgi:ribosomal protein S6E (S10)